MNSSVGKMTAINIDSRSERTVVAIRCRFHGRSRRRRGFIAALPLKNATRKAAGRKIAITLPSQNRYRSADGAHGADSHSAHATPVIAPVVIPEKKATMATAGNAVMNGSPVPSHGVSKIPHAHRDDGRDEHDQRLPQTKAPSALRQHTDRANQPFGQLALRGDLGAQRQHGRRAARRTHARRRLVSATHSQLDVPARRLAVCPIADRRQAERVHPGNTVLDIFHQAESTTTPRPRKRSLSVRHSNELLKY